MGEDYEINPTDLVRVTNMNGIIEVQYMKKRNSKSNIQKLSQDSYLNLATGEILEFSKSENRSNNINSLRQTFKKIREFINTNFYGATNELFITLTYAENMQDNNRLMRDFDVFWKRFRRYCSKHLKSSDIDYMSVVEPQRRGAWHCHVLVRFNDIDNVFIPSGDLADLWGLGFVKITSTSEIDNIGAYLSAYLADLELPEDGDVSKEELNLFMTNQGMEIVTKNIDGQDKKFIKGMRLRFYPVGMNIYRKSKGIIKPTKEMYQYSDIKKIVGHADPHYKKKYEVDTPDFKNTIIYEQYNIRKTR